jgi:hypothetical protein
MKKRTKKLTLHRETLCALQELQVIVGGVVKTVDATQCVTNCFACNLSLGTNCC